MLIVCDIDGTLANLQHRVHYVRGKPRNYDAFNNALSLDTPEKEVIAMVNALRLAGNEVIFASGRSEDTRHATKKWLSRYVGEWTKTTALYMRKSKDHRSDTVVKTELLAQIQGIHGQKPDIAIDDRLDVCRMWHEAGIKLLRVGNPDLDNNFNRRD